jgi:gliding motility-associated-like protein
VLYICAFGAHSSIIEMQKQYVFRVAKLLKVWLLAIYFIVPVLLFSQNTLWYFGNKAGLVFPSNNSLPKALLNGQMDTPEGCATFTDVSAGITYYSNGENVWLTNGQPVINGFLGDRHATQSAIFLQKPLNADTVYLFTLDADAGSDGLRYSVLVNGAVVNGLKNISLQTGVGERMCVVHHCNNEDAWLLVHGWGNNSFYAYRITGEGIDTIPVVSNVGTVHNGIILNATGYMKVSRQGDKLAVAKMGSGTVELFKFDNINGSVSNAIELSNISAAYGVEFSPDGTVLYASSASGTLYNFDLTKWSASDIQKSKQIISTSNQLLGALQLGPDDRIYVAQDNAYFLGMISAPNTMGSGCTYNAQALYLEGYKCESGLPPYFPNETAYLPYVNVACVGDTSYFGFFGDSLSVDSLIWDFGVPKTTNDISKKIKPYYIYPAKGSYPCQLIIYHCQESDTLNFNAQVVDVPEVNLGNDTSLCQGQSYTLKINPEAGTVYYWQNGSKGQSITVNTKGTYWVRATSVCGTTVDSLEIKNIWPNPVPHLPSDTSICAGDSIVLDAGADYVLSVWNSKENKRYYVAKDSGRIDLLLVDSNYCRGRDTFYLAVENKPELKLSPDTSLCYGTILRLVPGKADSYLWQDNSTSSYYLVNREGTYTVEMTNHCGTVSGKIDVYVEDCDARIYIPNAFTPNGDYINDVFKPVAQNIKDFHIWIYDRLGRLVFETKDINEGWDGRIKSAGTYEKTDAFFYKIVFHGNSGKEYLRRGFVNLIR